MCRLPYVASIVFAFSSVSLTSTSDTAGSGVEINVTACTRLTVIISPDNYMQCLQYYGRCLELGAEIPYDHRYYDAVRRNVAESRRGFSARRDVLPAVHRVVYDRSNLYLQRIGRVVYEHETCAKTVHRELTRERANTPTPEDRFYFSPWLDVCPVLCLLW
ncbi:Hypothetical protein CINCED_3A003513 [Cinara cedri]|uniref:Uncharacterized protein n=1 Tax=Cinara cedri TaxID=506608 RepID=A0A5E4NLS9_9HEMI|nr:Hypothetical protein CINCED_3A003513 [Cinara cedri]